MSPFEYGSVPRVVFGCGSFARIGKLSAELGRHAMILTNAGDPGAGGLVDQLTDHLRQAGVDSTIWRQRGEPQVDQIDAALERARADSCDVAIGFGGGSAIDAAKAVAGLLTNGGSPLDYMEIVGQGKPITKPAAPWIAVPTTAGTGAECTRNAVIGCAEKHFKASLRSPHLLADIALVDAELGVDVPVEVTARTGMDALCQLIESYTSNRAQPITDALALEGIRRAATALPRAVVDGHDLQAREDMALAAMLSGQTLANVGLGAVHGFAAPLGANLPVPHGTVCAALLPHVMVANVEGLLRLSPEHDGLRRYATVGRTLAAEPTLPDTVAIERGVQFIGELVESLRIPRLREFGLTPDRFPELAQLASKASSMRYNPVVLPEDRLQEILLNAW